MGLAAASLFFVPFGEPKGTVEAFTPVVGKPTQAFCRKGKKRKEKIKSEL